MAAASCTLTGTIKDIVGAAMDPSRVIVNLVPSVDLMVDMGTGEMRVGQKQVKPDMQGRWTFTNVWLTDTANTNPASFRWRIVLQAWPDSAAPRAVFQSSDFALNTSGVINIKDVDFVPVDPDPGWKSIFQAQMEAFADGVEASVLATKADVEDLANSIAAMWEESVMPTKMFQYDVSPGAAVNYNTLCPGWAYIDVELWHGASGGGYGNSGNYGGSGAAGTGRNTRRFFPSEITGPVTITVGAAGLGGVYPSTSATQGGLSSFGTWSPSTFLPSAIGGNATSSAGAAGGAARGILTGAGAADSIGSGGTGIATPSGTFGSGGPGGNGMRGGGGSGAGGNGSTGGNGGASEEGGGGGAGGGTAPAAKGGLSALAGKGGDAATTTTAATPGTAPGGGGAGGCGSTAPYCNGSAGGAGRIRVTVHWV